MKIRNNHNHNREYSVGLSYVGFSRVRKLEDLAIPQSFSKERIDKIADSQLIKDRISYMSAMELL